MAAYISRLTFLVLVDPKQINLFVNHEDKAPGSYTAAVSRLTISVAGLQADTEKIIAENSDRVMRDVTVTESWGEGCSITYTNNIATIVSNSQEIHCGLFNIRNKMH
jgi:hypothetical protein